MLPWKEEGGREGEDRQRGGGGGGGGGHMVVFLTFIVGTLYILSLKVISDRHSEFPI